jgi:TolB protein
MSEPVGSASHGDRSLLRSALASLLNPVRRLGRAIGHGLGRAIRSIFTWLGRGVARIALAFWAFLGRCGLALRHLLTLFIWRPLAWIARPFVRAAKALWAFLGRCGLALRHLLTLFFWRPLLFVSRPFRWLYGKTLRRPLSFAALSLRTFGEWFLRELMPGFIRRIFAGLIGAPRKLAHGIRGRITAWRVRRRAKEYDLGDVLAPAPRRLRLRQVTTAVVAASLILLLGLLTSQEQRALNVSAGDQRPSLTRPAVARLVPKMTLTPTPLPSPTPTASPSPTPIFVEAPDLWPTPDPLGKGGSVLFSNHQDGNGDLYVLALGRAAPIRLTAHPADDRDPAWSPDGRYLAFSSHRDGNWELYILDLFNGRLRRLTENLAFDGGPSWSPDGEWLVFESYREDNLDLYIIAADGQSPPIRLTENPAHDFSPAWSPDGRHIAFASWRDGNQDIFLLSLDAAFDDQAINASQTPDRQEDHPAFSPGGEFLAFNGRNDGLELIYTLPLEEYRPAGPALSVGQGRHPSWSPDGSSLAYAHGEGAANGDGAVNGGRQSYIIASSIDSWNVAPQAYAGSGRIDDLAWSGAVLPRGVESRLPVDEVDREPLFRERMSEQGNEPTAFMLQELDVDAPAPYLSDRVDDSFRALRQRVLDEAGWDFLGRLDNMFTFLTDNPVPGDTSENWNKAARAFDFSYREAISVDPQVEIVREDLGSETYWRVFVRTAAQDGSQGEPLRQLPWDFTARYQADPRYYDQGGKPKETLPAGYYLDFTALAADYGWQRAPALANWRTFFHGIRYWHFENRQGLAWPDALLELYTADELAQVNSRR